MQEIQGYFMANRNKFWTPNIQYTVLVLKDRLIFMKTSGVLADFKGGSAVMLGGGAIGGAIGGLILSSLELAGKSNMGKIGKLAEMSEEQIISANRANFVLKFGDIGSASIKRTFYHFTYVRARHGLLKITPLGKKEMAFDISPKSKFKDCVELLKQVLPYKVQIAK